MGFSAPDPVPALRPATVVASVESPIPAFVALYDDEGVLRCVGGDQAACLAGGKPIDAIQRVITLCERYPSNAQMLVDLPGKAG